MGERQGDGAPGEPGGSGFTSRRLIRAELVIATLALLTSACASVAAMLQSREAVEQTRATIDQTRTVASQLGASVWPYLTVDYLFTPRSTAINVTNQGLGPALIRSFTVSLDGKVQTRFRDFVSVIDARKKGRSVDEYTLAGGSVIRPSQTFTFLTITDPKLDEARVESVMRRVRIDTCYCSLLKDCWTLNTQETEPKAIARCGPPTRPLAN